ncbi:MAG: hypothetical protein QN130_12335 [Armatimonadota bacterium]|nr:hypothetical protein [Armatimonadota bacterium]
MLRRWLSDEEFRRRVAAATSGRGVEMLQAAARAACWIETRGELPGGTLYPIQIRAITDAEDEAAAAKHHRVLRVQGLAVNGSGYTEHTIVGRVPPPFWPLPEPRWAALSLAGSERIYGVGILWAAGLAYPTAGEPGMWSLRPLGPNGRAWWKSLLAQQESLLAALEGGE